MAKDELKQLRELIHEEIRPVKELVEVTHQKIKHIDFAQDGVLSSVHRIREQQSVMNEKLDDQSKVLAEHTDKIDALLVDVHDLQDRADTVWEKVSAESVQTKEDIHQIKDHLGLTIS